MKIKNTLLRLIIFVITVSVWSFSEENFAQCSVVGSVNSSTLSCTSFSGCTIVTVGNVSGTVSNLVMNAGLDLTCLGPITLVVKNGASLDFSSGNDRLTLAAGSGIVFESGSALTGSNCNASERIYIGNTILASCNGGAGALYTFVDLVAQGGYNSVKILDNPALCGPGNGTINVSMNPTPVSTVIYNLYNSLSGGTLISSITATTSPYSASFTTPAVSSTSSFYVQASNGVLTTPRKEITVIVNPVPVISTQPVSQLDCEMSVVSFKVVSLSSGTLTYNWYRKRPADSGFSLIGAEANISYPVDGELRIANVGNSMSPNGTQYRVVIGNQYGCSITSDIATLSINEITDVSGGTDVTQCLGTNYSYTVTVSPTSLPNVVTYQWKKSVTTGVWTVVTNGGAYSGADTATLLITNGTPSESAQYRVHVTFNNSTTQCIVNSATRTRKITFQPQLAAPVATVTLPSCSNPVGAISVSGISTGDTFSFDDGLSFQLSNLKSGLAQGDYIIRIKNASGCISLPATYNIDWSSALWNGSTWSKIPSNDDIIFFDGDYSSTDSDYSLGYLTGCSCLVKSGNVVINSLHTLSLQNAIVVTGGTFTLENNASLIQVNSVTNTGSIIVKRNSSPMVMYDYTYWSSPTSGSQIFSEFAPKSNPKAFVTYDNKWIYMSPLSTFSKGIGYAILAPEPYVYTNPTIFNHQFVGVPNNGNVNVPVAYLDIQSRKLVGNPFPSALDANQFITANNTTTTGTLYFWTHNHARTNSGYSPDYAVYNLSGGTAVSSGHANITSPTRWIASGQGFMVVVKASGSLVFNNAMRIGGTATNNSNFYRSSTIVNSEKIFEKHRVWLNLFNEDNAFSQLLLGYIESASNDLDFGFDGLCFGESDLEFYSLINNDPYVIQARGLPFSFNDEVRLGYKTSKAGNFKIQIDKFDGVLSYLDEIILEDKLLGISQNIKEKAYSFNSESGVFNNRFVIRYSDYTLNLSETEDDSNEISITSIDHKIIIQSQANFINQIFIYDLLGRLVFENTNYDSSKVFVNNIDTPELLVVKVILSNGKMVSKKIMTN